MSTVSIINAIFDTTKKQNIPGARKTTHLIFTAFMGINHIRLSSELIANLYPEGLVVENQPFLGGNRRSISFLVHYPDHQFLPEEQLVFLNKILSVCKLDMDDIILLNIARSNLSFEELKIQFHPGVIFFWGIRPSFFRLDSAIPDFDVSVRDGISIIPVLKPEVMCSDNPAGPELKSLLWSCLKKLFNL